MPILAVLDDADREFMKAMYVQYHMTMFRMARALTDSQQDAEDVVSDACVALIGKIALLKQLEPGVLEGYIISTTKNAAYMLHRKRNARREVSGEQLFSAVADEAPAPDERLLRECTMEELIDALDRLPEGDQAVIRMKYFEKLSDREIASALEIREVSVRSRLTRARNRLCGLIGGRGHEESK